MARLGIIATILLVAGSSYADDCCVGRVGGANGIGTYPQEVTIGDIQALVTAKFIVGTCDGTLPCLGEGDVNQSGGANPTCNDITIGDTMALVNHLYIAGPVNAPLSECLSCTVTDIDGNCYRTVTIGTQVWMAENLKVTHDCNGEAIPNVTDGATWAGLTAGAYCEYNNDVNNVATYGRLNNWYAVADSRNISPAGWHVASDAEWQTLSIFLGGDAIAGGKMKETGTTHWYSPNTGATNESGFSALPGGYRASGNGPYENMGYYAHC